MKPYLIICGLALVIATLGWWLWPEADTATSARSVNFPDTQDAAEVPAQPQAQLRSGVFISFAMPTADRLIQLTEDNVILNPDDLGFYINYDIPTNRINSVLLYEEPLGEVRQATETYVVNQLGIPRERLCDLDTRVITNTYVNAFYANRDLGFSFCPGAVTLE